MCSQMRIWRLSTIDPEGPEFLASAGLAFIDFWGRRGCRGRGTLDKGSNLYASATFKALIIQGFLRFWGIENLPLGIPLGMLLPSSY